MLPGSGPGVPAAGRPAPRHLPAVLFRHRGRAEGDPQHPALHVRRGAGRRCRPGGKGPAGRPGRRLLPGGDRRFGLHRRGGPGDGLPPGLPPGRADAAGRRGPAHRHGRGAEAGERRGGGPLRPVPGDLPRQLQLPRPDLRGLRQGAAGPLLRRGKGRRWPGPAPEGGRGLPLPLHGLCGPGLCPGAGGLPGGPAEASPVLQQDRGGL